MNQAFLHPVREWDPRLDLQALTVRLTGEIGGPDVAGRFSVDQLQEAIGRAWMMGAEVALNNVQQLRVCRICGCWELRACDPPCSWVAADLCSCCVPVARQQQLDTLNCGRCRRPASRLHTCEEC